MGAKTRPRRPLVALTALVLLVAAALWGRLWLGFNEVRAFWEGDGVRVTSIRNGLVVTHLVGWSQGQPAVAALPAASVTLDSGGPSFDAATLRGLEWRSPRGERLPPPAPGTEIRAIYSRPKYSAWSR